MFLRMWNNLTRNFRRRNIFHDPKPHHLQSKLLRALWAHICILWHFHCKCNHGQRDLKCKWARLLVSAKIKRDTFYTRLNERLLSNGNSLSLFQIFFHESWLSIQRKSSDPKINAARNDNLTLILLLHF